MSWLRLVTEVLDHVPDNRGSDFEARRFAFRHFFAYFPFDLEGFPRYRHLEFRDGLRGFRHALDEVLVVGIPTYVNHRDVRVVHRLFQSWDVYGFDSGRGVVPEAYDVPWLVFYDFVVHG